MVEAGAAIILVIDDEPVVRMLARRALESFGYITLGAKDGADGVRVLAEQTAPVAAVLLDMSMPGMTAEETLNAIHAADASTRVVIMTGFAEESAAALTAEGLIAGFLQKPFALDTLQAVMKGILAVAPIVGG